MCTLLVAAALAAPSHAASFACDKATTALEQMICKDAALSTLDGHLGQYYEAARVSLPQAQSCLQANQRNWLRNARNACKDAACLKQAYLQRLAELDALQPGATAIKSLALPKGPSLVAVVPPAEDTVAAPPLKGLLPLVVRGRLRNEVADGDGFVVQPGAGRKHIVMGQMFLEGAAADHLAELAKDSAARHEVRGHGVPEPDGGLHFAPSRCSFVYRLPG